MVNSFRSKMIHKKALFAVLTDERYARLFTAGEREAVRRHVPWTRKVREGKTEKDGAEIDLLDFVSREQRPPRAEAERRLRRARHLHRLEQRPDRVGGGAARSRSPTATISCRSASRPRARPSRRSQDDGTVVFAEQLVDLDPLLFNGKVGSAFTRLSSTELANVSSGGGMVPTFIIGEKV